MSREQRLTSFFQQELAHSNPDLMREFLHNYNFSIDNLLLFLSALNFHVEVRLTDRPFHDRENWVHRIYGYGRNGKFIRKNRQKNLRNCYGERMLETKQGIKNAFIIHGKVEAHQNKIRPGSNPLPFHPWYGLNIDHDSLWKSSL